MRHRKQKRTMSKEGQRRKRQIKLAETEKREAKHNTFRTNQSADGRDEGKGKGGKREREREREERESERRERERDIYIYI